MLKGFADSAERAALLKRSLVAGGIVAGGLLAEKAQRRWQDRVEEAMEEGNYVVAQANLEVDAKGKFVDELLSCRKAGDFP